MSIVDRNLRSAPPGEAVTNLGTSAPATRQMPGAEVGRWPYRLLKGVLVVCCLILETMAALAGGALATAIVPGLLDAGTLGRLALAYFVLAGISAVMRETVSSRDGASWLLWLALLLGIVATRDHRLVELESIAVWFVFSAFCIFMVRSGGRWLTAHWLVNFLPFRTIAFLGNSEAAATMLAQLRSARPTLVRAVGFFDDRLSRPGPLTDLLPCLGTMDDLVGYIHEQEIAEVYMALPWSAGPRISQLLERLRFLPLTVRLVPDHVPPALPGRGDGQIYGVVMPTLMLPPFSVVGAIFKRSLDIGVSALLLVPLCPLFMIVALCIRLDSRGPVFFRQVRSGQYGRPFQIFKFRTLQVQQADAAADTLVTKGDRRVTRVGRLLRKYSIDELPQVFNVLLGQMSLVGPRPHAPKAKADGRIYAEVIPEYMLRYRVKPGMTGWAQVNGWRGNTDTEEQLRKRVEFDFQYIGKWSPLKDLEIMLRTVPAMLLPPEQNV